MSTHNIGFFGINKTIYHLIIINEKRGIKQCLLDTPRRITVNNKRLLSKCKKSEKKYAYLHKPWHYEELQREVTLKAFAPSS